MMKNHRKCWEITGKKSFTIWGGGGRGGGRELKHISEILDSKDLMQCIMKYLLSF